MDFRKLPALGEEICTACLLSGVACKTLMFRECSDADDDIGHEAMASMLIAHRDGTIPRKIATGAVCSTSCYSPGCCKSLGLISCLRTV